MALDIGNAALAAIGGATQGAATGIKSGIDTAVGIQNFQNTQQEQAIRGQLFKEHQEENIRQNKVIPWKDVLQKTDPSMHEYVTNKLKNSLVGQGDGQGVRVKDLESLKEPNFLDKYSLNKSQEKYYSTELDNHKKTVAPIYKKAGDLITGIKKQYEEIKAKKGPDAADKYLWEMDNKRKDPTTYEGQIAKQYESGKMKEGDLTKKLTEAMGISDAANTHVEGLIKDTGGRITPAEAIAYYSGDKFAELKVKSAIAVHESKRIKEIQASAQNKLVLEGAKEAAKEAGKQPTYITADKKPVKWTSRGYVVQDEDNGKWRLATEAETKGIKKIGIEGKGSIELPMIDKGDTKDSSPVTKYLPKKTKG